MTGDEPASRRASPIVRLGPQPVRWDGVDLTVAIPDECVEQLGISAGDCVDVSIEAVYRRGSLSPELQAVFERVWQENEAGFRYLADHD